MMTLHRPLLKWTTKCQYRVYSILCMFTTSYTCENLQVGSHYGGWYLSSVFSLSCAPTLLSLSLKSLWASLGLLLWGKYMGFLMHKLDWLEMGSDWLRVDCSAWWQLWGRDALTIAKCKPAGLVSSLLCIGRWLLGIFQAGKPEVYHMWALGSQFSDSWVCIFLFTIFFQKVSQS